MKQPAPEITRLTYLDLELRLPTRQDAREVFEAVEETRAELAPWMPWCTPEYDLAGAQEWAGSRRQCWLEGSAFEFVVRRAVGGEVLGTCGINQVDAENRRANLGYWVRASKMRQGIATRAAQAVARFGHDVLELERLEILMACGNEASRRVAERMGAQLEGVQRRRLRLGGAMHDAYMFSAVRGDLDE